MENTTVDTGLRARESLAPNGGLPAPSRLTPAQGMQGDNRVSQESTQRQVSQRDYLQLLLAQNRRLENLEQENRKLLAERDVLNEKYQAQLQIVKALKSEGVNTEAQVGPSVLRLPEATADKELPMIDAAEFQPVQEQPQGSRLQKSASAVTTTVKSSAARCGRKFLAIMT